MPTLAVSMPIAASYSRGGSRPCSTFAKATDVAMGKTPAERQRLVLLVLALGMVMVVIGWARDPGVWRGLDRLMGGGSKPPAAPPTTTPTPRSTRTCRPTGF